MKKLSLFFITCLLSASFAWADVSVVENYSSAPGGGATSTEREYTGCNFVWKYNYGRTKTADVVKVSSSETQRAIWLTNHTDVDAGQVGYLNTTLEGGLKAVAFKFIQGAIADAGDHLYISIDVNGVEADKKDGGVAVSSNAVVQSYSKNDFEVKENDIAFAIKCTSTSTRTNPEHIGRVLVANVTITPYLLYTLKETSVGLQQRGFKNTDLIDNTGGIGTISYSSNAEGVATIDANGVITPVSVGDAVITANWDNKVSTTYTLHVVDGIINENFSQVVQTGSSGTAGSEWLGSVCKWDTKYARRGANDIVRNGKQCSWLSLDGTTRGYLRTKDLEGGIKTVSFNYAQFGAEKEKVLKWKVSTIGTETISDEIERDGDEGENRTQSTGIAYTHTFNCAENAQLEILNTSVLDNGTQPTSNARILIGDIKITPYLLYTTKEATLDTRVGLTYTNSGLINNTTGDAPTYSIAPANAAVSINSSTGQVAVEDGADVTEDFIVTASWSSVTTTYTLHIISRVAAEASYPNAVVQIGLNGSIDNTLAYTDGYDGTIAYTSSNTAVATVASNGTVSLAGGVGQTTITATLPQTSNYKAASASYILRVTDNSANVFVETFSNVEVGGVDEHAGQLWEGDVYNWRVSACGGVRKNDDRFASDQTRIGIWMGTPDPNTNYSSLTTEDAVEGGIKHIWFYCEQPYNTGETGYTLKPVIYLNSAIEANKVSELEIVGTSGTDNIANNRTLFGASNAMKSNSRLIIRNESYKTSDGSRPAVDARRGRFLLDDIHITPWLLYTNKATQIMRIGDTNKRVPDINTTAGESGTLSYSSSDADIASVASDGTVTAKARGKVTITAKYQWSESDYVTTTYPVDVWPVNCETFSSGETSSYYAANEESASGDKATWKARLAGIKTSDFEPYVALIRAPRQGEDKEAYLESSAIAGGIASMTFDWNLVAGEANTTWDIRILINGREVKRLGDDDLAEASKDKMENFGQITIPAINEPGNFIIRFENHSTVNGTYTSGNKARFVIDNICWTNYSGTKTLAENVNNDGWIRNNIGPQNVAISRSELKGGMWNTLCLPFALPVSTLGVVENGVQQLNSASLDGDELTIGFTPYTGDNLVAGTPYLVQPSSDVDISYTYNDVTITSIASPVVVDGGLVTLQGIFSPKELTAGDKNSLFVGTPDENGDNLFYPEVTGNLLGFRAYFKISEGGASSAPAIRRARFIVNEAQSPTALDEADNALQSSRKVLENGHLFIIRDGKKYNVTGQKIQ